MAELSSQALNALRGGYSGVNPDATSIYGLGVASSGVDLKRLKEQLKLEQEKLETYKQQFNDNMILDLVGSGWGTNNPNNTNNTNAAEKAIFDMTGRNLRMPDSEYSSAGGDARKMISAKFSVSPDSIRKIDLGPGYGTMTDSRGFADTGRPYYTTAPFRLGPSYDDTVSQQKKEVAARSALRSK